MILYRALSSTDIFNLNKYNTIYSSLFDSYLKSIKNKGEIRRNIYRYTYLCFMNKRKYSIDTIVGHISGKKITSKISPWISVSPIFSLVSSEYSIPQFGTYNYSRDRKPIAIIDIPDDKIISDKDELLNIRETMEEDFIVNLSDDSLNKFFDYGAIMAEKYNKDMPGYDKEASTNRKNGKKTNVRGFSNYATSIYEMLAFAKIEKKYIKTIISPEVVDIMYSINTEDIDFIIDKNKEIEDFINKINPVYTGKNLVDILYNQYADIKGSNIEEKYNNLIELKKIEISKIIKYINKKYSKNFVVSRILDDNVIVKNYNNLNSTNYNLKNDLVLIEKDNNVYYHDFSKKGFYNDELGELISNNKVLTKIYKQTGS